MLHLQQTLIDKLTKEQLIEVINEQAKAVEELKQYSESLEKKEKHLWDEISQDNKKILDLKKQYSQSQKRVAALFNYVMQLHQATGKGNAYILENVERILKDEEEGIYKSIETKAKARGYTK